MASLTRDMTQGKPSNLIVTFSLPLMAGNMLQQVYTMTDTAIVGQVVGLEALASLGAADWLIWMVLSIVQGFTQGFSICLAQRFGSGDRIGLRRAAVTSTMLSAGLAVVLTVGFCFLSRPILNLLKTPEKILSYAMDYITVMVGGTAIMTAYNLMAAMLRALGNSRTPLRAMAIAAAVNVALDFLFVAWFGLGIQGAAAATLIAQALSAVICFSALRHVSELAIIKNDIKLDKPTARLMLRLGTPIALQNSLISMGGLAVQRVINELGTAYIAAMTATNKLYGLLEIAATSFGYGMATFASQNLGARRLDRIKTGMRAALILASVTALGIGACMLLLGKAILSLFIEAEPVMYALVMDIAYRYLSIMSIALIILYWLHIYRSALQGLGNTMMPMVSGLFELAMRVAAALTLAYMVTDGILYAEMLAWTGAVIVLVPSYYVQMRRLARTVKAAGQTNSSVPPEQAF